PACRGGPPLLLEAGAPVLPVAAHPTTRDPASQLVSSSAPLAAARAHLFSHSTANTRCYTAIDGALPSLGARDYRPHDSAPARSPLDAARQPRLGVNTPLAFGSLVRETR